jgi:Zn finger protein HypA/HybF involved in hydrogenase expression
MMVTNAGQVDREIAEVPKPRDDRPLTVRCPNCKQTHEPDFNETTKRYVCPICASPVDAQVFIEKKKRGVK